MILPQVHLRNVFIIILLYFMRALLEKHYPLFHSSPMTPDFLVGRLYIKQSNRITPSLTVCEPSPWRICIHL